MIRLSIALLMLGQVSPPPAPPPTPAPAITGQHLLYDGVKWAATTVPNCNAPNDALQATTGVFSCVTISGGGGGGDGGVSGLNYADVAAAVMGGF